MTTTQVPGAAQYPLAAPGQTPPAGVGGEGHPSGGSHAWRPPAPGQPMTREELLLSALDDAAEYRRQGPEGCGDCVLEVGDVQLCGDHAPDAELAKAYDALYAELLGEAA